MRKDQIFPSKYLKEPDLRGRDVQVTIDFAERVTLNQKPALLLHFQGKDKGLVINTTLYDQIVAATGEDDTDDWKGHTITLFPTTTEYQGKSMPVVRVRAQKPSGNGKPQPAAAQAPPDNDPEDEDFDF
jgi:hypothetical protein